MRAWARLRSRRLSRWTRSRRCSSRTLAVLEIPQYPNRGRQIYGTFVLQHYVEAVLCDVRFRQEELRWARHHDRPIARERRSRRPPDKTDKSPSSVSSVTGPPSGSDLLEPDQLDRGERGRGGLTEFLELPAHSPAWLVSVLDLAAIRTCATSARRTCSPTGEALCCGTAGRRPWPCRAR